MISAPTITSSPARQGASLKSLTKDTACHVSLAYPGDQGIMPCIIYNVNSNRPMVRKGDKVMRQEKYVYCTITGMIGKRRGVEVPSWEVEVSEDEYAYIERMRIQMYHNQKQD